MTLQCCAGFGAHRRGCHRRAPGTCRIRADCVVYTSQAETRPDVALEELTAFLTAGTNVVGTSLVWLVYPPHADAWFRDPLDRCAEGLHDYSTGSIRDSREICFPSTLSLVDHGPHPRAGDL